MRQASREGGREKKGAMWSVHLVFVRPKGEKPLKNQKQHQPVPFGACQTAKHDPAAEKHHLPAKTLHPDEITLPVLLSWAVGNELLCFSEGTRCFLGFDFWRTKNTNEMGPSKNFSPSVPLPGLVHATRQVRDDGMQGVDNSDSSHCHLDPTSNGSHPEGHTTHTILRQEIDCGGVRPEF